jgi:hypothetical protein
MGILFTLYLSEKTLQLLGAAGYRMNLHSGGVDSSLKRVADLFAKI